MSPNRYKTHLLEFCILYSGYRNGQTDKRLKVVFFFFYKSRIRKRKRKSITTKLSWEGQITSTPNKEPFLEAVTLALVKVSVSRSRKKHTDMKCLLMYLGGKRGGFLDLKYNFKIRKQLMFISSVTHYLTVLTIQVRLPSLESLLV